MMLNVGCGSWPMLGWVNIDEDPQAEADIYVHVPPLPFPDNHFSEVYAGHFLEHLTRADATLFLQECYRILKPGGKIGIMVPDTYEVMKRYINGTQTIMQIIPDGPIHNLGDLEAINEVILFSTFQNSNHLWAYDKITLRRALQNAGFFHIRPFDHMDDPRVAYGAWYQFGLDADKPNAHTTYITTSTY